MFVFQNWQFMHSSDLFERIADFQKGRIAFHLYKSIQN